MSNCNRKTKYLITFLSAFLSCHGLLIDISVSTPANPSAQWSFGWQANCSSLYVKGNKENAITIPKPRKTLHVQHSIRLTQDVTMKRTLTACISGCILLVPSFALAAPSTSTILNVSSHSIPYRGIVTLTAMVTSGTTSVTSGQVLFCNTSAPQCTDTAILESVITMRCRKFEPGGLVLKGSTPNREWKWRRLTLGANPSTVSFPASPRVS